MAWTQQTPSAPSIDDLEKQLAERKSTAQKTKPDTVRPHANHDELTPQAEADILQAAFASAVKAGDTARALQKIRQLHALEGPSVKLAPSTLLQEAELQASLTHYDDATRVLKLVVARAQRGSAEYSTALQHLSDYEAARESQRVEAAAAEERQRSEDLARSQALEREALRDKAYRAAVEALAADLEAEMASIPGGQFQMGSTTGSPSEWPVHVVNIEPFRLSKFELTIKQWQAYLQQVSDAPEGCGPQPDAPVACVSWSDVQKFLSWLNGYSGRHFRLPTESEWEYAARAGTTTAYPWGDNDDPSKRNGNGSAGRVMAVGSYPPNAWGLHDMIGNLWEWVEDCDYPYRSAPSDGHARSGDCTSHMIRGGGWKEMTSLGSSLQVSARSRFNDFSNRAYILEVIGFRVAEGQ